MTLSDSFVYTCYMSCINTCYIGHVPHMTFIDNFVNIFWTIADMYLVRYLTLIVAGISWYCMQIRYLAFLCMLLFFLAEIFVANWILLSLVRPLWFWSLQILCISCMIPIAHGFCRKPWRIDLASLTFWLVCLISLLCYSSPELFCWCCCVIVYLGIVCLMLPDVLYMVA